MSGTKNLLVIVMKEDEKMRKTIQALLIFAIVLLELSGCAYKPADYSGETGKLRPEQVIEYYVNAWNEKNFTKVNTVLSDGMKAETIDYDSVESAKVSLLEPISVTELPSTVKNLNELKVYKVVLEIKRKKNTELHDETSTAYYYVGKATESSPWLIYDVGEAK